MGKAGRKSRYAEAGSGGPGPDFMCVGAQKAGTQWLYDQLAMHPQFWMPPLKELHYFDLPGTRVKKARRIHRRAKRDLAAYNAEREALHRRPIEERDLVFLRDFIRLPTKIDIELYARLFAAKGGSIAGDITPGYSGLEPDTIGLIAARFPALKVVFIARNPVDRFWSAFNMRLRRGDIGARTDVAAIRDFAERGGVKRRSSPSTIVRRWRSAMPEGQFALFFFDDLLADPLDLRRRILTFLDASAEASGPVDVGFNRKDARSKIAMSDSMQSAVAAILADELRACAKELGGPAVNWAKAYGV
jgi:Sulfotransferase family